MSETIKSRLADFLIANEGHLTFRGTADALRDIIEAAVREERERIAALADEVGAIYDERTPNDDGPGETLCPKDFGAMLREPAP